MKIILFIIVVILVIRFFYMLSYYSIKARYVKIIKLLISFENSQKFARYKHKLPLINNVYELETFLYEIIESLNVGGNKKTYAQEYASYLSIILHNNSTNKVPKKKVFRKLDKLEKKFKKESPNYCPSEEEVHDIINFVALIISGFSRWRD